jgi:acyl-CoA hydrolase
MWSGRETTATYAGGIHFYRPVLIGDLVEVEARLIHTDRRDMHVAIHVRSGNPAAGRLELTTQCMSILVAKGEDGRPVSVERFVPQSQEDIALDEHALRLVDMRAALKFLPVDFNVVKHRRSRMR